ncbi:protein DpdH [Methylophaga pinxianii]|uniref:protein DpdH n=1 Tax=Methylophaga pinxianii TaxID=2881052 RepID=UPI001CF35277|nr:protein DpdH [Methylophaga pinxianii]MCB2426415.1 ATP-binding protein [Methylophaga pinxianii]UPH44986.1 ATP-binding protein [Methylophaga pinxianii]
MPLINYWPKRDEINRCIKTQAESASDAVLLAVHQPTSLIRRAEGSQAESEASEVDLLDTFLSNDLPEGTLIMPIMGPSGSGKSHLIRWLAAQLGRDPRSNHMHVLRIPKYASLRDVVSLILEPLADDSKFAEVRASLDRAIAEVNPGEAAVSFSGALEISLKRLKKKLVEEIKNSSGDERKRLLSRARHAEGLPGLFNDSSIREHITSNVLGPIISRAVNGGIDNQSLGDEFLPQFKADDLIIPDGLRGKLGEAAREVQYYYQTALNTGDGHGREIAVEVLNDVIDEAVQQVFQIGQATGGITLESIILRVREVLFHQERELVLLVEDFAALSGIQQTLLNVCIQEADRDGEKIRAPMRTALALTDGYLVGRETIATRAKQEWIIQPIKGEERVVERTLDLVGAYLNAARWGEDVLKEKYVRHSSSEDINLTNWIDNYYCENLSPEDSDLLGSFGATKNDISLFPYNHEAVEGLVKRHLKIDGELRFNPRRVINTIIRDVLLSGRDDFIQGKFPSPGFEEAHASAEIRSRLTDAGFSETEKQRYEAVLYYWGGDPVSDVQVAAIPEQLFLAFGLKRPEIFGKQIPKRRKEIQPTTTVVAPKPESELIDSVEIEKWRKILHEWSAGSVLQQTEANKLRQILRPLLIKAIPWNSLRLSKFEFTILLTIPNAQGNDAAAKYKLPIADDFKDPSGDLQQTLLGAIRMENANWDLDYLGAEEDSARLANLIQRLVSVFIRDLESERDSDVKVLSWILYRQALILGATERKRMSSYETRINSIRNQSENLILDSNDESRWNNLRAEANQLRANFQNKLWARVGCYQGDTGRTLFAIDPTLINIPDEIQPTKIFDEIERKHLSQLKPTFLTPTVRDFHKKLQVLFAQVSELLGEDLDKNALLSSLSEMLDSLEPIGVWPGQLRRGEVKKSMEQFRNSDLKKQLDLVEPLLHSEEVDLTAEDTLKRLGGLNISVIEQAGSFLKDIETFAGAIEQEIEVRERELQSVTPELDAEKLSRRMDEIERDLNYLAQEGVS